MFVRCVTCYYCREIWGRPMASSGRLSADMTKVIFYVRAFNVYGKKFHKALLSY